MGSKAPPGDFVSSDVNEALQEARLIVTRGKRLSTSGEDHHMLEDSTSVQVTKSGSRSDPVEVIITRSTKFTQDSGTDEEAAGELVPTSRRPSDSQSDSDLCPRPARRASLENALAEKKTKKHTSARYRRRKNELWTKDEGEFLLSEGTASEGEEEQACLEVDVKEECRDEDGEGHVVIKASLPLPGHLSRPGRRAGRCRRSTCCPSGCRTTSTCARATGRRCPASPSASRASCRCTPRPATSGRI